MNNHPLAVLAAMPQEIALIKKLKPSLQCVSHVVVTGVGKLQAGLAVQELLARKIKHPDQFGLILVGSAGAIVPGLKPGDVVLSIDTVFHDVDATALGFAKGEIPFTGKKSWKADETLLTVAHKACHAIGITPHLGTVITGDRFVAEAADAKRLFDEHCALAVDWETAAVAFVADAADVPWVSIRVISDTADDKAENHFRQNLPSVAHVLAEIIQAMDRILRDKS